MLQYLVRLRKKKAFTLVEVIIVLVIIAIMAAVLVPSLSGYIDRARKAKYMLSAKNCMKAMQVELSELYAERQDLADLPNVAGSVAQNADVSFIGSDFAKDVLKTADDDPYMLIFGLGNYKKYIETERTRPYTVYFVAYWPAKNQDPIFFNGSEWTDKYPWKGTGQNTFKVDGKEVLLQFYFIAGPRNKDLSGNWNELKRYLKV